MKTYPHSPNAELRYAVDWCNWLENGESIASVAWDVGTGLTDVLDSHNGRVANIVLLATASIGTKIRVACTVTSTATPPQIDTRVFYVNIVEQ